MNSKRNAMIAGLAVLLISAVAFSQSEQTISIQVEVAPFVLLKDNAITFTQSPSNASRFDTGWVDIAYSNTQWQMSLQARPIVAVLAGGDAKELGTDYILEVNIDGNISAETFTVQPGKPTKPFALLRQAVPHDGSIRIRLIADAPEVPQNATGFVAPELPALTYSVATF